MILKASTSRLFKMLQSLLMLGSWHCAGFQLPSTVDLKKAVIIFILGGLLFVTGIHSFLHPLLCAVLPSLLPGSLRSWLL